MSPPPRKSEPPGDFFRGWERRAFWTANFFSGLALLASVSLAALFHQENEAVWKAFLISCLPPTLVYAGLTQKVRRRRLLLSQAFPPEWEAVLQQEVVFYRVLSRGEKDRFRRLLQVFIGEKRITGIKLELDTTTLVLAAASAVIPIFGFAGWEWHQINEILIYPARFEEGFSFGDTRQHTTLGMVGAGAMNGVMILSKPDLIDGFRNPGDKRNVGLHEFAHLVDKSGGAIDGVPTVGLNRQSIGPWIELVHRKMKEIEDGRSDIDPYALTNEAEFFAVATEYFFERPGVMRKKHPHLFAALERVFNQDLSSRIAAIRREIAPGRATLGRNSPCPCGSGVKFKKCCLRK